MENYIKNWELALGEFSNSGEIGVAGPEPDLALREAENWESSQKKGAAAAEGPPRGRPPVRWAGGSKIFGHFDSLISMI